MSYIILEGDDTLHLAAEVCKRMARGYRPLGGVTCCYDPWKNVTRFAQALVLEAESPAEPHATPDRARDIDSTSITARPRGPGR